MASKLVFGYPELPDAILAWGARAIFKPLSSGMDKYYRRKVTHSKTPLDILQDRQGWYQGDPPISALDWKRFIDTMNAMAVMPHLQRISTWFLREDSTKFVRHFKWPHDDKLVLVAQGSPNSSHGYFYLSVSLVPKDKAPREEGPDGTCTWSESRALADWKARKKIKIVKG